MRPIILLVGSAGLALAVLGLVRLLEPSDFWNRRVSFSCSYAPPGYSQVVYTEMHYSDGKYRVALHDLASGDKRFLSDQDATALKGIAADSSFLYERLLGNTTEYVWCPAGGPPRPLPAPPFGRFVPNVAQSGEEGPLVSGQYRGTSIRVFRLRDGLASTVGSWTSAQPFREPPLASWEAAVSPDGGLAAITSSLRGAFGLFLLDTKSQSVRPLRRSERILMRPRWDLTGTRLTLIEGSPGSWEVEELLISDGKVETLYAGKRFIETAELHPDRSKLLLTLGDGPDFDGYFAGLHVFELERPSMRLRQIGP